MILLQLLFAPFDDAGSQSDQRAFLGGAFRRRRVASVGNQFTARPKI